MSKNRRHTLLLVLMLVTTRLWAGTPDWLRSLAKETIPTFAPDVDAVVLLDEQTSSVNEKGEVKTLYRRAYKILTTLGRKRDAVVVYYDSQTELSHLKVWAIPPVGSVYESAEKDAVETGISDVSLYSDSRRKVLTIPYTEPGTVVGYQYERLRRSDLLQDVWDFQDTIPVLTARFMLTLPPGWDLREHWTNWVPQKPTSLGHNEQVWELHDLPRIEPEPSMPAWRAVAGRMAINIVPARAELRLLERVTWNEFGRWYWQLASPSLQASPLILAKVKELTSDDADLWSKMRSLAAYTQRNVRYVAIEVGLGGYQPHSASETLGNSYGDCKDKAALLSVMLGQIGVESFLVLTHTDRGVVSPDFPTMHSFNHEVLAIVLPASLTSDKSALYQHPKLGRLLIFDPTDTMTPLGMLPPYLQGGRGLLVTSNGGEIIDFPNQPADTNRMQRSAAFTLKLTGGIAGDVEEIRTGFYANEKRAELLSLAKPDRRKAIERFLSSFLQGFTLQGYSIENLENYDQQLIVRYTFEAPLYAKQMGDLWLVRPRVLGTKTESTFVTENRKYPLELDCASVQSDKFDIELPSGYIVDELGGAVNVSNDYARYVSKSERKGATLHYERIYEIDKVVVPVEQVDVMRQLYRAIASDERSSAVLRKQ